MDGYATPRGGSRADGPLMPSGEVAPAADIDPIILLGALDHVLVPYRERIASLERTLASLEATLDRVSREKADLLAALEGLLANVHNRAAVRAGPDAPRFGSTRTPGWTRCSAVSYRMTSNCSASRPCGLELLHGNRLT